MNEKRYISISASSHKSDSTNLKLFRALDSMEEYDQDKLQKLLGNSLYRNMAVIKQNLHKHIMRCLRNFHSGTNEAISMYEMLIEFSVMLEKKNTAEAKKILIKLENLATEFNNYDVLNICYKYERKLNISRLTIKTDKEINDFNRKYTGTIKKLYCDSNYRHLADLIQEFYLRKGVLRSEAERKHVKKFLQSPYLSNIKHAITQDSKELYHNLRGLCFLLLEQYEKALVCESFQMTLIKKDIPYKVSRLKEYVAIYNNRVEMLMHIGRYKEALESVNEFRMLPSVAAKEKWTYKIPVSIKDEIEISCFRMEVRIYFKSANFDKMLLTYDALESKIKRSKIEQDGFAIIDDNYYTAYGHFISGNYKQTLVYLKRILKYGKDDKIYREDIYSFCKILQLITHYEMEDEQLSAYLLKSTYRFLAQRKRLYPTEEALMLFMRNQLHRSSNPDLFNQNLMKLKLSLEEATESGYEKKIVDYFDFITWIESKLKRKPFSDILKNKYYAAL